MYSETAIHVSQRLVNKKCDIEKSIPSAAAADDVEDALLWVRSR